jgi:EpsI family protein
MGQIPRKSILILIGLFSFSAIFIHARSEPVVPQKTRPLSSALEIIPGWTYIGQFALDEKIIQSLELDEYINAIYGRGTNRVSLYIGYYLTSGKVGAAHDPLVCFPGQGWSISRKTSLNIQVNGHPPFVCSMLVAELGTHRELILYWFQAYDTANSGTFQQKLSLLWKKLRGQGQDNAFIRVTASLDDTPLQNQQTVLVNFIEDLYPLLIEFISEGNRAS